MNPHPSNEQENFPTREELDRGHAEFHAKLVKEYKEMTGLDWDEEINNSD